jgi:hypothetical protein
VDTRKFTEASGLEFRDDLASLTEDLAAHYRAWPGGAD